MDCVWVFNLVVYSLDGVGGVSPGNLRELMAFTWITLCLGCYMFM